MPASNPRPASRTISWRQLVLEADPDWVRDQQRPMWLSYSNGREFVWRPDVYVAPGP